MSEIIQADFEKCAALIFDDCRLPLAFVSVGFALDNLDTMKVSATTYEGYPFRANPKKLELEIDGLDTRISVIQKAALGSLVPPDAHFHLEVPDPDHRKMVAKYSRTFSRRQK